MQIAPKHVLLAGNPRFLELLNNGENFNRIALILTTDPFTARAAAEYHKTGKNPTWAPKSRVLDIKSRWFHHAPKFIKHSSNITELYEKQGMSMPAIAKLLGISNNTAYRAYKSDKYSDAKREALKREVLKKFADTEKPDAADPGNNPT